MAVFIGLVYLTVSNPSGADFPEFSPDRSAPMEIVVIERNVPEWKLVNKYPENWSYSGVELVIAKHGAKGYGVLMFLIEKTKIRPSINLAEIVKTARLLRVTKPFVMDVLTLSNLFVEAKEQGESL